MHCMLPEVLCAGGGHGFSMSYRIQFGINLCLSGMSRKYGGVLSYLCLVGCFTVPRLHCTPGSYSLRGCFMERRRWMRNVHWINCTRNLHRICGHVSKVGQHLVEPEERSAATTKSKVATNRERLVFSLPLTNSTFIPSVSALFTPCVFPSVLLYFERPTSSRIETTPTLSCYSFSPPDYTTFLDCVRYDQCVWLVFRLENPIELSDSSSHEFCHCLVKQFAYDDRSLVSMV